MSNSRKRSEASLAAAKHWTNKRPKFESSGNTEEAPIIVSGEEEHPEDIVEVLSDEVVAASEIQGTSGQSSTNGSPIKLFYNSSYDESQAVEVNKDTVKISDLIGMKDLKETYQFNFNVDLEFFLTFFHPDVSKEHKKIKFITGSRLLSQEYPETKFIKQHFNISEIIADISNRFGTHHSKMMINFFEDNTVEIVIMTCNLTKLDFGGLTQMCWRSGRLVSQSKNHESSDTGARFQKDLKDYLHKYKKSDLDDLAERLAEYDFSPVNVELLASAPGTYDLTDLTDDGEVYGYGKLYQILRRNNLLIDNSNDDKKYNILAQASAISYPFATLKTDTASIFSHLLCPLAFSGNEISNFSILSPGTKSCKDHQAKHNYRPHILYPCVQDIAQSNVGFAAGEAVHFNYSKTLIHRKQYEQNIKPYIRKWGSNTNKTITGREKVAPHVKLYMCDNGDNWSTLKWVLMCSHNLSKQAWGSKKGASFSTTNPMKYEISSYELGVLVPGNKKFLAPSYGSDTYSDNERLPIRLPFKLPPDRYKSTDQPWSAILDYGDKVKDVFGHTYNGYNG